MKQRTKYIIILILGIVIEIVFMLGFDTGWTYYTPEFKPPTLSK